MGQTDIYVFVFVASVVIRMYWDELGGGLEFMKPVLQIVGVIFTGAFAYNWFSDAEVLLRYEVPFPRNFLILVPFLPVCGGAILGWIFLKVQTLNEWIRD